MKDTPSAEKAGGVFLRGFPEKDGVGKGNFHFPLLMQPREEGANRTAYEDILREVHLQSAGMEKRL